MNHLTTTLSPHQETADCLIIPVLKEMSLSTVGAFLNNATQGQLLRFIKASLISELGQTALLYEPYNLLSKHILVVSCGDLETLSNLQFQKLIASVAATLKSKNIHSACFYLEDFPTDSHSLTWKTCVTSQQVESTLYQFETFKTNPNKHLAIESIYFHIKNPQEKEEIEYAIQKGIAISQGMHLTKDLANMPANHATPTQIAAYAKALESSEPTLEVTVYDKLDETVKKMGAFLAVAQGSSEPPQFVVIKYTPSEAKEQAPIVLVGKGVTFDAGGISLKPSANMGEMKFDMAGAASVLGTIKAIAQLKVPVPVIGLLPLTENLPSGSAFKPGDIIKTLSGKTVEILDTDAEGRLILADALTYSRQFNPAIVIDIATLTGAVVVALGEITTGLMTKDTTLKAALESASEASCDRLWALPLWDEYQTFIDSNVADMANLGSRGAGSITAACFLARFTEGMHWAHLDIAGTGYISGKNKTATGRPVPLLVQYILDYCETTTV